MADDPQRVEGFYYQALRSEENAKYEQDAKSRSRFPPAQTALRAALNAGEPVVVHRSRFGNGRVPALPALPAFRSAQLIRAYPDGTVEPAESP